MKPLPQNIQITKYPNGTKISWDYSGMTCQFETGLILSHEEAFEFLNNLDIEGHENMMVRELRSVSDCYSEER